MSTKDSQGSEFQKWYKENKDSLNQKRRNRYANDPSYREVVKERQAAYRKANPPASRAGLNRYRVVGGVEVETFRIGDVARLIGRTECIIRYWEKQGIIPKPSVESRHRYYTKYQVSLLKDLADIIDLAKSEGADVVKSAIEVKSKEIHNQWNKIGD